jgi:micrococcal nuclease
MFSHNRNRITFRVTTLAAMLMFANPAVPATAGGKLEGPVPAIVTRVIDGDTIEVRAQIWLEQEILVKVRLAGVEAPEMTAACDEARRTAQQARDFVVQEVGGARVLLMRIRGDKYFGRVVGHVMTPKGEDLSSLLLAAGLATPYSGGRRAAQMC